MPMRTSFAFGFLLCSLLMTGCHCCGWSEHYADMIDDVSDHQGCLDRYYCEKLDVTRLCMNKRCCNTNCR